MCSVLFFFLFFMTRLSPCSTLPDTLFPYTSLLRPSRGASNRRASAPDQARSRCATWARQSSAYGGVGRVLCRDDCVGLDRRHAPRRLAAVLGAGQIGRAHV